MLIYIEILLQIQINLVTDQMVLKEPVPNIHALIEALYQKLFLSV